MIDKLKSLWVRLTVHWHVVAAAVLAALPEILNYLGIIDLKPILSQFLHENTVDMIVGALPFVLLFLKPMLVMDPEEEAY